MVYDVIGHSAVRASLKDESGPFALLGPSGVGRTGILAEWGEDKNLRFIPKFDMETAKSIAAESLTKTDVVYAVDADLGRKDSWMPLLKPLEEGWLNMAIISTYPLPLPVMSRLRVYRVGFLTESEILKILATKYPRIGPRPWIAKACGGALDTLSQVENTVSTFEDLDKALADRVIPRGLIKDNPLGAYHCFVMACGASMGIRSLPFSRAALSNIPKALAKVVLSTPVPVGRHEARNSLFLFLGQVTGG
jgi:hypothetical protein